MSSTITEPTQSSRRNVIVLIIVVLSIAVPLGIIGWSVQTAMSGKPFGQPSNEVAYYPGALKNGEMWFWVRRAVGTGRPVQYEFRIKRIDLETGIERETDIAHTSIPMNPIWLGDELYAFQNDRLYQLVGQSFVEVALLPPRRPPYFRVTPFLHEGRISTIVYVARDEYRLVQLVDQKWTKGRRIILPSPDSREAQLDIAYPIGVQFADDDRVTASALEPANSPDALLASTAIHPASIDNHIACFLSFDRDGPLFVSSGSPSRVARQDSNGFWTPLEGYDHRDFNGLPLILANPSEPVTYLINSHPSFVTGDIRRIEGNIVRPVHAQIRGTAAEYLARWKWCALGAFVAWLAHLAILVGALRWLTRRPVSDVPYQFGKRRATVATDGRRACALATDLMLCLTILCLLTSLPLTSLIDHKKPWSWFELDLSDTFYECERAADEATNFITTIWQIAAWYLHAFAPYHQTLQAFEQAGMAIILVLCGLRVWLEGRYGITPGKWLFRIRTVRTTLRPCGFARALLRDALYGIDIPFFITPIPAVISMTYSPHRQRWGDRIADTIVVNAGSIHANDDNASVINPSFNPEPAATAVFTVPR